MDSYKCWIYFQVLTLVESRNDDTFLIPMTFNVPMRVGILGIVILTAGHFDLFESPLRQIDVRGSQITSKHLMFKSERSHQRPNLRSIARIQVLDNINNPMILIISNSQIAITRNFILALCNGSRNRMRMQIPSGMSMNQ